MCKMKLTAVYNKDIVLQNERFSAAIIYRGRPKSDTPKTYKQIGGFVAKELSNAQIFGLSRRLFLSLLREN